MGVFNSPESAQAYLQNGTPGQVRGLGTKLGGYGQETDWLREQQGKLSSVFQKGSLLNDNAPGIDGTTVNRLTGDTISRTTVKAARTAGGLNTNANDIVEALEKGTLKPDDTVYGIKGMKDATLGKIDSAIQQARNDGNTELAKRLAEARKSLKFQEHGNMQTVSDSAKRLQDKVADGRAATTIGAAEAVQKIGEGALIGAAVGFGISSLTTYIRYRKGELTKEEAFREIGEDTVQSTISGGAMAGITLFLPPPPLGFVAGYAIGMYLNATLRNILDEIFGKGAYREILDASGYVMGTSRELVEALQEFKRNRLQVAASLQTAEQKNQQTRSILDALDARRGKL
jgi:hypothetical protein